MIRFPLKRRKRIPITAKIFAFAGIIAGFFCAERSTPQVTGGLSVDSIIRLYKWIKRKLKREKKAATDNDRHTGSEQ